jgi:Fe-S-cluster containining protein
MQNPANPKSRNLKRKNDGSCIFFTTQNKCQINHIKPAICTLEPFIIADFDHYKNKIFLKLNPLANKECKGVSFENTMDYEEIGKAAQTIIKDLHELVAKRTDLLANDRRLGVLVRDIVIS